MIAKRRISFIDEYRGFIVVLMVFYHFIFDLQEIFGVDVLLFNTAYRLALIFFIGGSFILISGISSNFSKNNLKRGLICFGFGMILTLATRVFMPEMTINFGILHFLGVAMISSHFLKKIVDKINIKIGLCFNFLLFLFTLNIGNGYLGFEQTFSLYLPKKLYELSFLFPFGICREDFISGDYYPIIPWIFLFFIGTFLGKAIVKCNLPEFFYKIHCKALSFIGKNSLLIYLFHQPIIYAILYLLFSIKR
ncbi:MAG: heparan-alpha-glucosaminide N-acetyltransferase [Oscillospiraceae bacterium]